MPARIRLNVFGSWPFGSRRSLLIGRCWWFLIHWDLPRFFYDDDVIYMDASFYVKYELKILSLKILSSSVQWKWQKYDKRYHFLHLRFCRKFHQIPVLLQYILLFQVWGLKVFSLEHFVTIISQSHWQQSCCLSVRPSVCSFILLDYVWIHGYKTLLATAQNPDSVLWNETWRSLLSSQPIRRQQVCSPDWEESSEFTSWWILDLWV